jgi:hypothetical protein
MSQLVNVSVSELVNKKQYIMYLTDYKDDRLQNFYKGTFRGVHSIKNNLIFVDVIQKKTDPEQLFVYLGYTGRYTALIRKNLIFFPQDVYTFHDIDQVKENKKKAIETMEKRTLDMVLKRLVNEHFEW